MLNETERQWVQAIVRAAVEEVIHQTYKDTNSKIEKHVDTCPHAMRSKAVAAGILVGVGLFATNGALTLIKTLITLLNGAPL
jgi:tyrosine-protein phosphatase YwqE